MRKKVALLLAFVMMLSMLPMNVFGAPGFLLTDRFPSAQATTVRTSPMSISIDATPLAGRPLVGSAYQLVVRLLDLGGTATQVAGFAESASVSESAMTFPGSGAMPAYLSEAALVSYAKNVTRDEISLVLTPTTLADAVVPGTGGDRLRIDITNVQIRGNAAGIEVWLYGPTAPTGLLLMERVNLVELANINEVVIRSIPGEASTTRLLDIFDIEVRDVAGGMQAMTTAGPGVISHSAIRLTAPAGYHWIIPNEVNVGGTTGARIAAVPANRGITVTSQWDAAAEEALTGAGTDNLLSPGAISAHGAVGGRQTILIPFDLTRADNPIARIERAGVVISGLQLLSPVGATDGEVLIDVAVGFLVDASAFPYDQYVGNTTGPAFRQTLNNATHRHFIRTLPARRTAASGGGTVAQSGFDRSGATFSATVVGAVRGQIVGAVEGEGPEDPVALVSGDRVATGQTSDNVARRTVTFTENVRGTLLGNLPTIELRLREPGITFANAQWQLTQPEGASAASPAALISVPLTTGSDNYLFPGSGIPPAPGNRVITLSPRVATGAVVASDQETSLELVYALNVPAGWAAENGSTITAGMYHNGTLVEVVTLATVVDRVNIPRIPTQRARLNAAGLLEQTVIPSITIEETATARVRTGHIWLYLEARLGGNPINIPLMPSITVGDHSVEGNMAVTVNSVGRVWGNPDVAVTDAYAGPAGVLIDVTRASIGDPSTITLSNIQVTGGQAFQGVDFYLVIGGPAIVDRHYSGTEANTDLRVDANRANVYRRLVIGEGRAGNVAAWSWNVNSPAVDGVRPFRLIGDTGMAALRAFTTQIGGPEPTWDGINRIGTIGGINQRTGHELSVSFTVGSPTFTLRNLTLGTTQTFDIATWQNANSTSTPRPPAAAPGSIRPVIDVDDRMVVPLRVAAYLFGLDVAWRAPNAYFTPPAN